MFPSPAATGVVRDWARSALCAETRGGASAGAAPGPPAVAGIDPDDLLAAVRRHRLVELLLPCADAAVVPATVRDRLRAERDAARRASLVRVLETVRIGRLLEDAGVPWLSVKGCALAVQTAGDPVARGAGDVDLFVSPDSVRTVFDLLVAHGWRPKPTGPSHPGSWVWRHVLNTYYEMTFDGPGSRVDVHWRLDPTHDGLPSFEAAWARRTRVDLGPAAVDTLGVADAFTHSCHHAAKDGWRTLRSLVDVHRLARRPEVWAGPAPRRLDLAALAVTARCLGLPPVPAQVEAGIAAVPPRVVHRALAAQERAVSAADALGTRTAAGVRYRFAASRSPLDLRQLLLTTVLPSDSVVDLDDARGWVAAPRLLAARVRGIARRTAERSPRGRARTPLAGPP